MKEFEIKKQQALKDIIRSFLNYKGSFKSSLEIKIENLKDKITIYDYDDLKNAFDDYINYLTTILACTRRLFVDFNVDYYEINVEDTKHLFEDI